MRLKLGFSPCPNDTFIFDALVNGRIDNEGLEIDYFLADVEELNRRAFSGDVDITKISCHAFTYVAAEFLILDAGSAIGYGNGPLLIGREQYDPSSVKNLRIAIPGKYTTANLLFSIFCPESSNRKEYLFSDIEDVLLKNEADAGLLIHETRFTYQKKGLRRITDLGEFWENLTSLPIPLGVIAINRNVPATIAMKFNRILRKSVEYAIADSMASYDFVSSNAREMDSAVMNSHIKLFVNEFSVNLGNKGKNAIKELFRISNENKLTPAIPEDVFLTGGEQE